jgi:hypothetical protein
VRNFCPCRLRLEPSPDPLDIADSCGNHRLFERKSTRYRNYFRRHLSLRIFLCVYCCSFSGDKPAPDHPLWDARLTDKGIEQARKLKEHLAHRPSGGRSFTAFDLVVVSPLTRTLETANHIFGERLFCLPLKPHACFSALLLAKFCALSSQSIFFSPICRRLI